MLYQAKVHSFVNSLCYNIIMFIDRSVLDHEDAV